MTDPHNRRLTPTPWDTLHQSSMPPTDDKPDSDRIAAPDDMPHEHRDTDRAAAIEEAEFQENTPVDRGEEEPPTTLDVLLHEIRFSRNDIDTKIMGLASRFTDLQSVLLHVLHSQNVQGERSLASEETVYNAAIEMRKAATPERGDSPEMATLKVKLLVFANVLGGNPPRKRSLAISEIEKLLTDRTSPASPGSSKGKRRGG